MPAIKILLFLLLFASPAIAQWNSDAYEPRIGITSEVDTIYGSKDQQNFGTGIMNIGSRPGESTSRIWLTGVHEGPALYGISPYYEVEVGEGFRARDLIEKATKLPFKLDKGWQRVPLARANSHDLLVLGEGDVPTIFWEDVNGNYDTANSTRLLIPKELSDFPRVYHSYRFFDLPGYHTFLTNDTVQDVVMLVTRIYDGDLTPDSVFAVLFKAGSLADSRVVYPTEWAFVTETTPLVGWHRYFAKGDWRGTGREDLISADPNSRAYFYYASERPFDLQRFAKSLTTDTLMTQSDEPRLSNTTFVHTENALTMRAYPHIADSLTNDLVMTLTINDVGSTVHLFKGHSEFGTNRLTSDSAAIRLNPFTGSLFDFVFDRQFRDLGDMTGTGNQVLYASISQDGGFSTYHLFYVTGEALDDTADMVYFVQPRGRADVDTITANGDDLQDVILGIPGYYTKQDLDQGKTGVGTIHLLYGSNKIPVKGRSSVASSTTTMSLSVYPNPCYGPLTVQLADLHSPSIDLAIHDILGRILYRRGFDALAALQAMTLDLSVLEAGVYFLQITSGDRSVRTSLRILPH